MIALIFYNKIKSIRLNFFTDTFTHPKFLLFYIQILFFILSRRVSVSKLIKHLLCLTIEFKCSEMASESKFCTRRLFEVDRSSITWKFDCTWFYYAEYDSLESPSPERPLRQIDGEW
jgi:hypothetical protein